MDKNNNSTSRRGGNKTRIIVERVYNGTQNMEEAFRVINEQNAVNNIRAMMNDQAKQTDHQTAQSSTKTA
ncbi:MAG: hypothetical protein II936_05300 [Oscillospiraceae bacterium]|nr:hypothetical protein [Oscillospiraceae bacterium]